MGGVFLGDVDLEGLSLRDMRSYTTGPVKGALREKAETQVRYFKENIEPLLKKR